MARIAPESRIVDLSHGVPPLNVMAGATLLVDSLAYLASDAVLVAIVDPSVAADRDVAIEAEAAGCSSGLTTGCSSLPAKSSEELRERWRSQLRRSRNSTSGTPTSPKPLSTTLIGSRSEL
jgi:hypothetical protein